MWTKGLLSLIYTGFILCCNAQDYRWQQRVEYTMDVHLDVKKHRLQGTQKLIYHNQSNDTLTKVYYHLFYNAFQPGSMMDVRSRNIADPDKRIGQRISRLDEDQIGYQHIISLHQDGKDVTHTIKETILEVTLASPLLPKSTATFDLIFEAQVPVQIRRTGRDNIEGIAYSMTQWYPKLAEYDHQGWHISPYVAREFHSVWGDYDVRITIDPDFVVGGTGILQNPEQIGHGYESPSDKVKRSKKDLTWHFIAKDVHDFAWAADPDYTHDRVQVPGGPELHFFYQKNKKTEEVWSKLPAIGVRLFQFMNERFGKYPFETYSVIQGGDGGMEYPMCTLILGEGTLQGTAGTMIHEVVHSWFQMVLANNEIQYAWMDEGFTQFAEHEAMRELFQLENPFARIYKVYRDFALAGKEEPASQFSDFYTLNRAYTVGSYIKGCIMLNQLRYIIGEDSFRKGMLSYYNTWKFRHPEPIDFIRVMEKVSGMQLKWYLNYWIHTTKQIDYAIENVEEQGGSTLVTLARKGELPMPVEVLVTYKDGTKHLFYIPLNETFVSKPLENNGLDSIESKVWTWVNPSYSLTIARPPADISSIEIDPLNQMADVRPENNRWPEDKKASSSGSK